MLGIPNETTRNLPLEWHERLADVVRTHAWAVALAVHRRVARNDESVRIRDAIFFLICGDALYPRYGVIRLKDASHALESITFPFVLGELATLCAVNQLSRQRTVFAGRLSSEPTGEGIPPDRAVLQVTWLKLWQRAAEKRGLPKSLRPTGCLSVSAPNSSLTERRGYSNSGGCDDG